MTQPRLFRAARITAASLAVGAMLLTGCTANVNKANNNDAGANASAFLTIPREDMGTFVQNFNPFTPTVNPMVQQSIYAGAGGHALATEPLLAGPSEDKEA